MATSRANSKKPTGRRDTKRGRFYDFENGKAYPSVTTILGVLNKPALIGWAAKEERKLLEIAFKQQFDELREVMGDHLASLTGSEFVEGAFTRIGAARAHTRVLREAADIGTQVHKAIEHDILAMLGKQELQAPTFTSPKAEESWKKYLAWKASVRMVPLSTEAQIVSHVHRYAGTEDIRLRIWPRLEDPLWGVVGRRAPTAVKPKDPRNGPYSDGGYIQILDPSFEGLVVTGDFKTGKGVYGEMFLQNGAYRLAEREMGIEPESDAGIIIRLPKNEDDPDFEVVAVPPLEETVPTFLALRHGVWPWVQKDDERYERKKKEREERAKEIAAAA